MSRIKSKKKAAIKVSSASIPEYVAFSWLYLTTNKRYNFSFFKDNLRDELSARHDLSRLIMDLCSTTWTNVMLRRKTEKHGLEMLPSECLNFLPNNYQFSEEQKVIVFRFGKNNNFRLVGVKHSESNTLYIIGYDFDYSAYDHGS